MINHFDYEHTAVLTMIQLVCKLAVQMEVCNDTYLRALYQREIDIITVELEKRYNQEVLA